MIKMAKKIFFKLIKCENCGYNYRYISDRKISKYICSGYSRQLEDGCKVRHAVGENELVYLIQIFCNRNKITLERSHEFMKSIINKIYVNGNSGSIKIEYKNGEIAIYSSDIIHI